MLIRLFNTLIAALILLGISNTASAQIITINVGGSNGSENYMQVYEYDAVTVKPCFPGGEEKLTDFINTHRQYPKAAYDKGIQGTVSCWFIVNTDGSVSNISIRKSISALLDNEAVRIFSLMPKWSPGRINGMAVPVRVFRSVKFRK